MEIRARCVGQRVYTITAAMRTRQCRQCAAAMLCMRECLHGAVWMLMIKYLHYTTTVLVLTRMREYLRYTNTVSMIECFNTVFTPVGPSIPVTNLQPKHTLHFPSLLDKLEKQSVLHWLMLNGQLVQTQSGDSMSLGVDFNTVI